MKFLVGSRFDKRAKDIHDHRVELGAGGILYFFYCGLGFSLRLAVTREIHFIVCGYKGSDPGDHGYAFTK